MHKIHSKEFTPEDFSIEHLYSGGGHFTAINVAGGLCDYSPKYFINMICQMLNFYRDRYLETRAKQDWWQLIQLLPSSYNQKRTVMLNYEVLHNIYISRKDHKLDEWHTFCDWIEELPYSDLITLNDANPAEVLLRKEDERDRLVRTAKTFFEVGYSEEEIANILGIQYDDSPVRNLEDDLK